MKYLVMECHPGYAVVLNEDGRFLKVANLRYEVGQTVTDVTEVTVPQPQSTRTHVRRWRSQLIAMAACLVLVVAAGLFYGRMPYASVYMTINPQVRIDVSRADRVLDVEGMNPDGVTLLQGFDPGRKDLDTVMDALVDRAIDMGYLHEGGTITLSLDGSESWVASHGEHLNQHLQDRLTQTISVTVDVQTKQPAQEPVHTVPEPIVIPVGPESYGDSDYGESDYREDGSDYGDDSILNGDSDYMDADDTDNGQSDYDGDSSREDESDYEDSADGESDYEEADDTEEEPSDYEDDTSQDSDSDYETSSDAENGQSDYADDTDQDSGTDYTQADDSDDGQTDYGDWESDDSWSDYDSQDQASDDSDYEDSDYNDN